MKFPVEICPCCGLDLTTAEPAEIKNPGEVALVGTCPQCSAPYFMLEGTPEPVVKPEAPPEVEPEPEPPVVRGGRRRASEPSEPEPTSEPEPPAEE